MNKIYTTAYSTLPNEEESVKEIHKALGNDQKLIIFFASSNYNSAKLAAAFKANFSNTTVAGCSTSGEIVSGKMLDNSVVALGFENNALGKVKAEMVTNVKKDPGAIKTVLRKLEDHFGEFDYEKHVGIVLTDGLSGTEELVMDKIGDASDITFIGGSSGDDLKFKQTTIYLNDKVFHEGTLLLVLEPKQKFSILKTQSFKPTGKVLKVTKGAEHERKIIEFNHKPATTAYAEALGVPADQLDKKMFYSPLGLMNGSEPFVRSPRVVEGTNVYFFCGIQEGMDLMLLESTDIIEDTRNALRSKEAENGKISGIINFNCILRTLDLKQQKRTDDYGKLFEEIPTVGFSTYGESYIGHINQTATMLVFHE